MGISNIFLYNFRFTSCLGGYIGYFGDVRDGGRVSYLFGVAGISLHSRLVV